MSSQDWTQRYLDFLGLQRERPGIEALQAITRRHLQRVPFENLSSLFRRAQAGEGPVPALDNDAVLARWLEGRGGGVCFDTTAMLLELLQQLGYDAHPVAGQITFPASHQAVHVRVEGRAFLVDVGCGAPLFEPIPLEGVHEVHRAGLGYRFRAGEEDSVWWQERLIDGKWAPFCRYDLSPATDELREEAYQRHHTPGEGWVVGSITLVRCHEDEVLQLRDRDFTRHTPNGKQAFQLSSHAEYRDLLSDSFGLPRFPIEDALDALEHITGRRLVED